MGGNIEGFDWDEHNVAHIARHGVRPEEGEQVFANGAAPLKVADVRGERRFYDVGETDAARLLYVVWTRRRELRRVVGLSDATGRICGRGTARRKNVSSNEQNDKSGT